MTQADILQSCQWDDMDFATLTVDSALLGQRVTVRFMPAFDSGRLIAAYSNDWHFSQYEGAQE